MTFEDWAKLVLQSNLLAALVVGCFGLLTLRLGLGKFRSEKWWEKKASAYASVIEGLHGMYDLSLAQVESIEVDQEISEDRLSCFELQTWLDWLKFAKEPVSARTGTIQTHGRVRATAS